MANVGPMVVAHPSAGVSFAVLPACVPRPVATPLRPRDGLSSPFCPNVAVIGVVIVWPDTIQLLMPHAGARETNGSTRVFGIGPVSVHATASPPVPGEGASPQ